MRNRVGFFIVTAVVALLCIPLVSIVHPTLIVLISNLFQ